MKDCHLELREVGGGEREVVKVELWVLGLCKQND